MEYKRHPNQNQGFNFGSRAGNSGNSSYGSHGGYPNFPSHHPHPSQHNVRGYKNDMHSGRLNLTHSYRNLLKMQEEMVNERDHCFGTLSQYRDLMISRISSISSNLLKDEFLDILLTEVQFQINEQEKDFLHATTAGYKKEQESQGTGVSSGSKDMSQSEQNVILKKTSDVIENLIKRLKAQKQETINHILEETRMYAAREQALMETILSRERRVDKELMEFFADAERQIMDYEKKLRSDNYAQMVTRLRNADREISLRDQKIIQLEDTVKMLNIRSEKVMAELQQVNADHQFEKLQLYHHVEVCKINAKCLAMEELSRIFKWKLCACGRNFDTEILRDVEIHFNNNGFGYTSPQEPFGRNPLQNMMDRKDFPMPVTGSWSLPLPTSSSISYTNLVPPAPQPIPTGSFIPSEEAATKGVVLNDLRDRYDELQLKAAAMPNYEEVRTMIMKIVCHFKLGDLRVCEEMGGKKFVSSLFYCNSGDLVPSINDKVFSTGFGDSPEEATARSVKKAYDEIQRMENNSGSDDKEMELTYVRKNCSAGKRGELEAEPIRMTLIKSYCSERLEDQSKDKSCFQEAHLYKNQANSSDNFMADWKIHLRVEDENLQHVKDKLKALFTTICDMHISNFIVPEALEEKNEN